MPCIAEFGIINEFDKDKDYSEVYEPQKYNCVAIDDDILNDWWNKLTSIKTYFHCYSRQISHLQGGELLLYRQNH